MKNLTQLGVASALIGASLLFSACGGDSASKAEAFVKEKYPDAKILTFDEAKKEFGFTKNKDCLVKKGGGTLTKEQVESWHFIKTPSGEIESVIVKINPENGALISITNKNYGVESLKSPLSLTSNCF